MHACSISCLTCSFCQCFVEILGHCTRPSQAVTDELVYNVDGWQLHLYISYYDGRHDVHSTHPGVSLHSAQWAFHKWFFWCRDLIPYCIANKKALLTPRAARDSAPWWIIIQYRQRLKMSYFSQRGAPWWIGIQYRHLAEICVFIPLSYSAPPLPICPVEFRGEVKHQETRVMGLLCGEGCVILTSTVFDWSTRVADGWAMAYSAL